nr:MAG TPA: methyltransferase [Caudoviricetes sp.]
MIHQKLKNRYTNNKLQTCEDYYNWLFKTKEGEN